MGGEPGVYCILNLTNGKRYIGQSDGMQERVRSHFNCMKRHSKNVVPDMQIDYDNGHKFVAFVLDYVTSDIERKRLEYLYQKNFSTYKRENGYNYRDNNFYYRGRLIEGRT